MYLRVQSNGGELIGFKATPKGVALNLPPLAWLAMLVTITNKGEMVAGDE